MFKIKLLEGKINIISDPVDLIKGSGRVILLLASGIKLIIQNTCIQQNKKEIYLTLKISAEMDIILRL